MIRRVLLAGMILAVTLGATAQEMKHEGKHEEKHEGAHGGKHGDRVTAVITHEVKDYAAWKKVFDGDAGNRTKGGFKISGLYRDAKSPNWVTVVGEFRDLEAAQAFVMNPKLKEAMEAGGVMGKPDIKFLTRVGS